MAFGKGYETTWHPARMGDGVSALPTVSRVSVVSSHHAPHLWHPPLLMEEVRSYNVMHVPISSVHKDLSLEGFKRIFYMEYAHRMWGRLIGLTVLLPAAGFWAKGWLGPAMKRRAVLYSGLVIAQGLLGWWMVKSGLENKPVSSTDVPRVSQYRLASHLAMAVVLYSSMLYTALGVLAPPINTATPSKSLTRLRHGAHGATALIFITALSGMHSA